MAGSSPPASELLSGIVSIAAEERSLRSVLRRSASLVVDATGADACFVHVVDRDRAEVVLMGAHPTHFDELAGTIRLRLGEGLAGWVAEHGQVAVVDDKWSDPRYRYIPALRGEDYRSLVSAPLLRPDAGAVGVVNVHAHEQHHFAPDVVDRLTAVADLLAGIVEGAVLYEKLRQREEQLERFAEYTIELQEVERRRIAGDIHDGISQRLVSAWYHLRAARAALPARLAAEGGLGPGAGWAGRVGGAGAGEVGAATGAGGGEDDPEFEVLVGELAAAEDLVSAALEEARGAVRGLRPTILDDLGLPAAIESLVTGAGPFEVDTDLEACRLPPHLEMCVYRVAQEAVQNVVKHAHARRVRVSLCQAEGQVQLTVSDDGIGIVPAASAGGGTYGLGGMVERAALVGGTLEVAATAGAGTEVRLRIPVAERD